MKSAALLRSLDRRLPWSAPIAPLLAARRIAVVVPAYNEARLIARTLSSIPDYVGQIVVVDDASRDDTAARARANGDARVEVLRHARNRGVGAAIVTGYRHAFARGAEVCAVMAGDGQMDPYDLQHLLWPVLTGRAAYAKGDRLSFPGARRAMPATRWFGNLLLGRLTALIAGVPIRDSQCGFTALSREAAARLPLDTLWSGYGYPNDLLGMLSERDLKVREVMVRPVYGDEESGIRLWHALFVVPFVLVRVLARRVARACSGAALAAPGAGSDLDHAARDQDPAPLLASGAARAAPPHRAFFIGRARALPPQPAKPAGAPPSARFASLTAGAPPDTGAACRGRWTHPAPELE